MKCLRCGHCCLTMLIPIIIDPEKEVSDDNVMLLDGTQRCPHLIGGKPGGYSCKIHHYEWFSDTPCGQFGQIETHDSNCRLGSYKLQSKI